jgi:WD40 repeat protein
MLLASSAFDNHDVKLAAERLDSVPPELRRWEWYYSKQQIDGGMFTLYGHTRTVTCVALSPDGTRIVTGAWEANKPGEVKVWDALTGTALFELREHPNVPGINSTIKSVAFSPDGTRIITGGENNTAKVWDARTGAVVLELKGHTTPVLGVAFSPDGTRIITGGDPQYGTPQGDPSGMRIVPVTGPGEVKVWDARTARPSSN